MSLVLDSSVALSWLLPGEAAADDILERVVDKGAWVPALWPLEVANVLLAAERKQRITQAQRTRAIALLRSLPIAVDAATAEHAWGDILTIAATHGLTVYDAAYLELALRLTLPLATFDVALNAAATRLALSLVDKPS